MDEDNTGYFFSPCISTVLSSKFPAELGLTLLLDLVLRVENKPHSSLY
jgi:hypothetical protein